MNIWAIICAAGLALGIFVSGWGYGTHRTNAKWELIRLQSVEKARQQEADWQTDVQALNEVKDDEIRQIAVSLESARRELRTRAPTRMPSAATPACDGASPAALSAEDANVALGLAAEADRLRADYQACRQWIETVTKDKP